MDRAPDYGSGGWGFKSLRAHHRINRLHLLFSFDLLTGHGFGHGSRETSSIHRVPKVSWGKVGIPKGCLNIVVSENLFHGGYVDSSP